MYIFHGPPNFNKNKTGRDKKGTLYCLILKPTNGGTMRKYVFPTMLLSVLVGSPLMTSNAYAQTINNDSIAKNTATIYYVAINGLRVRATPEDTGKTLGLLGLNEKVRIISDLINNKYVQVEIIKANNVITNSEKYFVARDYLSETIIDYKEFKGKFFSVLNVATETLRIYEKVCADNSCPHKMIMETEVVVGEDRDHPAAEKGKGRSVLGSYRLTGWSKFYQDSEAHYPSWYNEQYPELPKIGDNDWNDWFKKKIMPEDEKGKKHGHMRGAFGWYAGFVAPNPYGQWTHGTIGWGIDKDKYIKKTKTFLANLVSNPRSSGCTRNNNEAIAYIRQLLDTGAPMIKIYAKEALFDGALTNYRDETKEWKYIMTKRAGEKADRAEILKALNITAQEADLYWSAKMASADLVIDPKSPLNQIIEVGTYNVDIQPTVINYTPGEKLGKIERSVGRKGNVYGVKSKNMSDGIFYVDAGMLSGYSHPTAILETGGFENEVTPSWMEISNLNK